MRLKVIGTAAAMLMGFSLPSKASIVDLVVTGNDALGSSYTAHATLDVSGGFAASGSGTINDAALGGNQNLTLITAPTPGTVFNYRSNAGDDAIGLDNAVPLTGAGLLFAIGNNP